MGSFPAVVCALTPDPPYIVTSYALALEKRRPIDAFDAQVEIIPSLGASWPRRGPYGGHRLLRSRQPVLKATRANRST
ncbi:MAG: hypothetical protein ABJD68_02525 [Nakamurella sp.]